MKFKATPLAMTQKFFKEMFGYDVIGITSDYEVRQTIEVEAGTRIGACDKVWQVFQNVDDDWLCPDNGRSLMVGDIVKLEPADVDEDGEGVSYHRIASMGWDRLKGLSDRHAETDQQIG